MAARQLIAQQENQAWSVAHTAWSSADNLNTSQALHERPYSSHESNIEQKRRKSVANSQVAHDFIMLFYKLIQLYAIRYTRCWGGAGCTLPEQSPVDLQPEPRRHPKSDSTFLLRTDTQLR